MRLDASYDSNSVVVRAKKGGLRQFLGLKDKTGIHALAAADRPLAFALADVRLLGDQQPGTVRIQRDAIHMRHRTVAALDSNAADALGLPPIVDLVFRTDVEGSLGTETFRLVHEWRKFGIRQSVRRVGAILQTEDGDRRLPLWLLEAVEVAEGFVPGPDLANHWEALARFRHALEPEPEESANQESVQVAMTDFLEGLEVCLVDRFGMAPKPAAENPHLLDFDPVPFYSRNLDRKSNVGNGVREADAEIQGDALAAFQDRVRKRGALSAYRLGQKRYLAVDQSAHSVLSLMGKMQRANPVDRDNFVRNPRAAIAATVEEDLRQSGRLEGLSAIDEEEAIETTAEPMFVETREYSARVTGVEEYEDPGLDLRTNTGIEWLPKDGTDEPESAKNTEESDNKGEFEGEPGKAVILQTKDNFDDLNWEPRAIGRPQDSSSQIPSGIVTSLRPHQAEGLQWQQAAWSGGLSGVLNADEQGLGKTLQTIAFLRSLQDRMDELPPERRGPILVVAPTSLLSVWEEEVDKHCDSRGLGRVIPLYGTKLGKYKRHDTPGWDTQKGHAKLDLKRLTETIRSSSGNRMWMITTYATMTNYQHSLASVSFAVAVFDEIQALKNPGSLRSFAARAINADFRIGLTGTPIENRTSELWSVMDQLVPGALGSLSEFEGRYAMPNMSNMEELHRRLFDSSGHGPSLAQRRMKKDVSPDLPSKTRLLYPRVMPNRQIEAYDTIRGAVRGDSGGFQALHRIRQISAHPDLAKGQSDFSENFVADSARLKAAMQVIQSVQRRNERALVFVEHLRLQYRFAELARHELGLEHIDIINGGTPIWQRQAIVKRFQGHRTRDKGFDLLILGTRAAGTGLTLTAATHVIHLSRWWNPAVEEQCNDRVHRIGQNRPVTVHIPLAVHPELREQSFDCLLQSLMTWKLRLAGSVLWPMGETESDIRALRLGIVQDAPATQGDPIKAAIEGMFRRDGKAVPAVSADGAVKWG